MVLIRSAIDRMIDERPLLLGFLIGFIARFLAELAVGFYPLGYDTSTFYVYMLACNWWKYIFSAPVYSLFLYLIYLLIHNAILAVKIGGLFACGFYTFSLTYWALRRSDANKGLVFSFVLFVATFWISIKLNLDMHRNVVSISFGILAIATKNDDLRKSSVFSFLSSIAHPFGAVLLAPIYFWDVLKGNEKEVVPLITSIVGASIIVLGIAFVFGYDLKLIFTGRSWYISREALPLYFLWVFLPIWVPMGYFQARYRDFIVFLRNNQDVLFWVGALFLASLILKFGYRIQWLAYIPMTSLVFKYATTRPNKKKLLRRLIIYNAILMVVFPVVHYVYNPFPEFIESRSAKPAIGTFYPWEGPSAERLFREALEIQKNLSRSVLLIRHTEISYAYAAGVPLCGKGVYVMNEDQNFGDVMGILKKNYSMVLLVWYIDPPPGVDVPPEGSKILLTDGPLALYKYDLSLWRE